MHDIKTMSERIIRICNRENELFKCGDGYKQFHRKSLMSRRTKDVSGPGKNKWSLSPVHSSRELSSGLHFPI